MTTSLFENFDSDCEMTVLPQPNAPGTAHVPPCTHLSHTINDKSTSTVNSQWRESWKSASVVNAHLMDDPTIRQPGFALPRQQWSLLNRFCTGQGHCGVRKKKWKLSDSYQCSCGETQTMSHIVESCPQTRLHGGLSKLHSADDDAVVWLTSYGS